MALNDLYIGIIRWLNVVGRIFFFSQDYLIIGFDNNLRIKHKWKNLPGTLRGFGKPEVINNICCCNITKELVRAGSA